MQIEGSPYIIAGIEGGVGMAKLFLRGHLHSKIAQAES